MTDDEFDYFNWRADQLQSMLITLAEDLGQYGIATSMAEFQRDDVVPACEELLNGKGGELDNIYTALRRVG